VLRAKLENNLELLLKEGRSKGRVSLSTRTRHGRQGGTEDKEEYCKVASEALIAISYYFLFGFLI
jgi:hypothetical protein